MNKFDILIGLIENHTKNQNLETDLYDFLGDNFDELIFLNTNITTMESELITIKKEIFESESKSQNFGNSTVVIKNKKKFKPSDVENSKVFHHLFGAINTTKTV